VSNGIEAGRMQIKAWGGKKPIQDKHGPQAQSNVRVEIEILEN
jgi:outer membrane protein OmpA-like peptidoglycan-associated protein